MLFLFFFILGLVIGAIHLLRDKQPRTAGHVAEVLLLWLLVITIGVGGLFVFLAHTVWADSTAVSIGWPTGNPFQTEVAVANLAIGVLGILCYWFRDNFWLATVIGNAVWQLGDAVIHIRQIIVANNWAPNNAGVTLYTDIAIPIVLIVLLAIARRHAPDRAAHRRLGHQPRLDDEVARHRRSGRVYRELVGDCRGAVANCIPELEVVDPDSFAICLSTCDGRN